MHTIQTTAIRSQGSIPARLLVAGVALLLSANAGLAADDAAIQQCYANVQIRFSIAMAQCSIYPIGAPIRGECEVRAIREQAAGVVACAQEASKASVLGGALGPALDGLEVAPETGSSKPRLPGFGKRPSGKL